jgi:hypothetical protein
VLTSIQVTFLSIERLKIGGPGAPSTSVSIQMNAVPQIGVGVQQQKKCTMQFQLKNADAGRFLQALNVRGQVGIFACCCHGADGCMYRV